MPAHSRLCLLVLSAVISGIPIASAQSDPVSIFRQAIEARNKGDLDGLMKLFAPDAVREDGSCNPPCVGWEAVKQSFQKNLTEHFQASLISVEGSGDTVSARSTISSDEFRARGIESRPSSYTVRFKGDKIVRWSSPLPPKSPAAPK